MLECACVWFFMHTCAVVCAHVYMCGCVCACLWMSVCVFSVHLCGGLHVCVLCVLRVIVCASVCMFVYECECLSVHVCGFASVRVSYVHVFARVHTSVKPAQAALRRTHSMPPRAAHVQSDQVGEHRDKSRWKKNCSSPFIFTLLPKGRSLWG